MMPPFEVVIHQILKKSNRCRIKPEVGFVEQPERPKTYHKACNRMRRFWPVRENQGHCFRVTKL